MYRFARFARPPLWLKVGVAVTLALVLLPTTSRAGVWTASGNEGNNPSGSPLSASADFEFTLNATPNTGGILSITLTNTLAANIFRDNGQGLSDIKFTLSNDAGSLTSSSASGQFGNISKKNPAGVVTYVSADSMNGNTSPLRWLGQGGNPPNGSGSFSITGGTILMEAIGGGGPSQMITPYMTNGGTFTNANQGLDSQNSWVIGPATFTLALSGITAQTTVTAVQFSFGTGPDTYIDGSNGGGTGTPGGGAAPAPPSVVLLGFGGLGLGLFLARSRRRLAAAM